MGFGTEIENYTPKEARESVYPAYIAPNRLNEKELPREN
jgi:hypothetical protein